MQKSTMREARDSMWKCPKCGREFAREEQGHYCLKPANIDEYISQQEAFAQPYLRAIRETIRQAIPEAEEKISWSMPTYWKRVNLIQFAASKKHIGLYPGPEAVEEFAERLTGFQISKGTVRLPYDKALPLDVIRDMAIWCYHKWSNSN